MTTINTLTVNGAAYTLEDPTAARVLMVEMDEVHGTASHRAEEIIAHLDKGPIFAIGEEILLPCGIRYEVTNNGTADFITFRTATNPKGSWLEYTVDDNGALTVKEISFATSEQIGDIETALDGILAIQNQLIGGDSV